MTEIVMHGEDPPSQPMRTVTSQDGRYSVVLDPERYPEYCDFTTNERGHPDFGFWERGRFFPICIDCSCHKHAAVAGEAPRCDNCQNPLPYV